MSDANSKSDMPTSLAAATTTDRPTDFHLAISGGGLAGLTCAVFLSHLTRNTTRIALVAPRLKSQDGRTTALLAPTVELLESIGVWHQLEKHAAPLKTMRLLDGTQRLLRFPCTDFRCAEMGMDAFGYNVPNALMVSVLENELLKCENVQRFDGKTMEFEHVANHVQFTLDDGTSFTSQLAIAADGRHSLLRQSAKIATHAWSYPQTAIVLTFEHSLPHDAVSAEFHTETGPFTQVPLPPTNKARHRSSLVWVVEPKAVLRILDMDLEQLSQTIEEKTQACFGRVTVEAPPQSFPLSGMTARHFANSRTVLIGEAGHVLPPIGAQGFNLGLRDISDLGDCIKPLIDQDKPDFGSQTLLDTYDRKRRADVHLRTAGVDILNRTLLSSFLPVQAIRALGVTALGQVGWLRRLAMQQGLGQPFQPPTFFNGKEKDPAAKSHSP